MDPRDKPGDDEEGGAIQKNCALAYRWQYQLAGAALPVFIAAASCQIAVSAKANPEFGQSCSSGVIAALNRNHIASQIYVGLDEILNHLCWCGEDGLVGLKVACRDFNFVKQRAG